MSWRRAAPDRLFAPQHMIDLFFLTKAAL